MDNPRPEKVAVVTEVREHFERSNAAILTEYRGLTVKDLAGLRRTLREAGGEYKIYKNTLVRFAAHDLGLGDLDSLLVGPTAIAFVDGDAASVAKALRDYARTNPKLTVKGGVLGTKIMSVADATALADLPPRDVVLARLAGALAAPMQTFAGLLQAIPRSFAYGLKALIEKRGGVESEPEGVDASTPADGSDQVAAAEPEAPATDAQDAAPEAAEPVAVASADAPSVEPDAAAPDAGSAGAGEPQVADAGAVEPAAAAADAEVAEYAAVDPESVEVAEPQVADAAAVDSEATEPEAANVDAVAAEPGGPAAEPQAEEAGAEPALAEPAEAPDAPEVADATAGYDAGGAGIATEDPADGASDIGAAAFAAVESVAADIASAASALVELAEPEPEPEPEAPQAEAEAVEPEALEVAADAALTPALADEPPEVEPLAAHGIPAHVEPEILSVEPEPDVPAVDGVSPETPPAEATAPDRDIPPAD